MSIFTQWQRMTSEQEPDAPVCDCPKCDGKVYWRQTLPASGLICSECYEVYADLADIATAEAYYLEQWAEYQD